jgi:4-hydroxybenzoate polyprenyltransferase/phosphoserine phosphatase
MASNQVLNLPPHGSRREAELAVIDSVALCVDLDGSLIRTDLLYESVLLLLKRFPASPFALLAAPTRGRAALKAWIAERVSPQPALLPYNEPLLEWLRSEHANGRHIVLCTAADSRHAHQVAEHLGIFHQIIASDGRINNSSTLKSEALVRRFGARGFDYVGNSSADIPVWKAARRAIVVGGEPIRAAAARVAEIDRVFAPEAAQLKTWVKGLRLHQWLKNLLLFVPLLAAHRWGDLQAVAVALVAFIAFGMCASAVYVVNDLFDLESDRRHPRKRLRAFASGAISIPVGIATALVLLAGAIPLALDVGPSFTLWLLSYIVLTKSYTFWLKSIAPLDCFTLAGLYTLRIVAGGAAIAQPNSFWLLAFSLFLFLSLAFVKRYAELVVLIGRGESRAHGRGYTSEDRHLLQAFGVASGFASALVLALYLNSDAVLRLYSYPERLWFALPPLLFWICWVWLRAARGQMHDDPVIFAVRDRASLLAGAVFIAAIWIAK